MEGLLMSDGKTLPDVDQQKVYLAIWEKAVDTQMHFNEVSVKVRQFGLTFVAAARRCARPRAGQ
jgi:hypothetical protein